MDEISIEQIESRLARCDEAGTMIRDAGAKAQWGVKSCWRDFMSALGFEVARDARWLIAALRAAQADNLRLRDDVARLELALGVDIPYSPEYDPAEGCEP